MLQLRNDPMSLLDADDEELDRMNHDAHGERELTLSTGAILGIFFGLVLLCGLFFGFGYKMGSHKTAQTLEAATADTAASPSANFGAFKPAAGSPAGTPSLPPVSASKPPTATPTVSASEAPGSESTSTSTPPSAAPSSAAPLVHAAPTPPPRNPQPATGAPSPIATGSFVVQVAAVSHQEDADLLVGALRAKGYPVAARAEPQDKLFHIQVGPYTNRKDADSIRQRLLSDGYNPIVK